MNEAYEEAENNDGDVLKNAHRFFYYVIKRAHKTIEREGET